MAISRKSVVAGLKRREDIYLRGMVDDVDRLIDLLAEAKARLSEGHTVGGSILEQVVGRVNSLTSRESSHTALRHAIGEVEAGRMDAQ